MSERIEELRHWYFVHYETLTNYVYEHFPILHLETIHHRLLRSLPQCSAKNPPQFLKWCKSKISTWAAEKNARNELTVAAIVELARSKTIRAGVKPFTFTVHDGAAVIPFQDSDDKTYQWRVPLSWIESAAALWPVHLRWNRSGPYISKRVSIEQADGRRKPYDLPIHSVFVNAALGSPVTALNGDYLDYTNDNLKIIRASASVQDYETVYLGS